MSTSLDKKGFSARDVFYILTIALGFSANYYTMNDRVGDLEDSNIAQAKEVAALKEANKAYASLPKDMARMQIDIEKNGKTITLIYYGLVAESIIPPPK